MQKVISIPKVEFETLLAQVERLEEITKPTPAQEDKVYNVPEAAQYLQLTREGIRKARPERRLSGLKINEKKWGFHQSELEHYKKRYNRS